MKQPSNMFDNQFGNFFEFIMNNKVQLILSLKEYEATGSQNSFDPNLFKQYLLFILPFGGLNNTIKLRVTNPDSITTRRVLDNNNNLIKRDFKLSEIDGINYRFPSDLQRSAPGAYMASKYKSNRWFYEYKGHETKSMAEMTEHISSTYPEYHDQYLVYNSIRNQYSNRHAVCYPDLKVSRRENPCMKNKFKKQKERL